LDAYLNRKRTIIFVLAVFALPLVLSGILAGALGWRPALFGQSMEQIGQHFRWIDRGVTASAVLLLYVWFLRPLRARRLLHALVLFGIVEALGFAAGVAVTGAVSVVFVWQPFAIHLAIGLVAVGVVTLIWRPGSNSSLNRTRDEAPRAG
jgi:hypothetical protein